MAINQTVTISPDVLAQEVSGETVLLDLRGEKYLGLNEVGTRVWQLLQANDDMDSIFNILLAEYEVESDILESDLAQLIADMEAARIVTVVRSNT